MDSARQKLLSTLAHKSFRLGEFKLSSGGTSDYYIDCRTTTLDAKGCRLTGEVFCEEIRQRGWKPRAVGGLTMGADPIVVAVSVVSDHNRIRAHGQTADRPRLPSALTNLLTEDFASQPAAFGIERSRAAVNGVVAGPPGRKFELAQPERLMSE